MDLPAGIACLLLCCALFLPGSALQSSRERDPILRNIEEYRLVVPVSTDSEGRFLSNLVSGPPRGRFRRDAGDMQHEASNEQIFYNVTVFGREFHFRLRLNSRLVAPGATIEWQEDSNVTHIEPLHGNCLYVGDITDLPNASVAISNCDGLAGMIRTDKDEFFIEPQEKGSQEEDGGRTHVVYRRAAVKKPLPTEDTDIQYKGKAEMLMTTGV